jgi:hypothetical protein
MPGDRIVTDISFLFCFWIIRGIRGCFVKRDDPLAASVPHFHETTFDFLIGEGHEFTRANQAETV